MICLIEFMEYRLFQIVPQPPNIQIIHNSWKENLKNTFWQPLSLRNSASHSTEQTKTMNSWKKDHLNTCNH